MKLQAMPIQSRNRTGTSGGFSVTEVLGIHIYLHIAEFLFSARANGRKAFYA
jgi:hypothetical protein